MNKIFSDIFRNFDPKQKGFKRKLMSFIFFLFISTAFWFLNALNESYSETISYPVSYHNFPKDQIQTLELPEKLIMKVEASGYDLLDYYLSANIKPLQVNFEKDKISKTATCSYILTKDMLTKNKPKQLKGFDLQALMPDTLKFNFDKITHKKVPVLANIKYSLAPGYVLKTEVKAFPDSILISGTEQILSKISSVSTGALDVGEIKADLKRNVAIKRIQDVEFSEYRTNILLAAEQATENILEIPITLKSQEANVSVKLIPNVVKVSYKVGLSRYKGINKDFFKAQVVLGDFKDQSLNNKVLAVELDYETEHVFDVEYTPHFVEYIVESHD